MQGKCMDGDPTNSNLTKPISTQSNLREYNNNNINDQTYTIKTTM